MMMILERPRTMMSERLMIPLKSPRMMMSERMVMSLEYPTMMMRSESKKLNSLRETTFVTSSHVAATAAIHVITKSLPSYGKSLKKEKHQKIDKIQPCQVQSLARLHALTVATMMHVVQRNKNIVMNAAQRLTKNKRLLRLWIPGVKADQLS